VNTCVQPRRTILHPILAAILRRVAIFQVCITVGFEIIFVLGALSAQKLNGTDRISGVATTTVFALGQLIIAMPVGKWMDRYGRRPVLFLGSLAETAALLLIGTALLVHSPIWFSLGLVMLGLGSGAAQMAFLIGGDIYPPSRKAEGLGLMTTYISIGIVAGPYLVGLIGDLVANIGWDPMITPWFCVSSITALASWLMFGLHPEPLEVAHHSQLYFPDDQIDPEIVEGNPVAIRSIRMLLRHYPIIASMGIMMCFQGVRMSLVPLLTYILRSRGFSLALASLMVAAMGLGMVMSSYLVGRLGDSWGRKNTLFMAVTVGTICAVCIPLVSSLIILFLLLVALGVAFSTALTITRVILVDATIPQERGVAMALNSIAIGVAVVLFPTISSYVLSLRGWSEITWIGALLMILALGFVFFLRETSIGKWDQANTHPLTNSK